MKLRLILFVIVFSLGLFFYGIDNIFNDASDSAIAERNKKCVTLTYEQFAKRHPAEGWFHITGGVLDLPSARAHIIGYGHDKAAEENGTVTSLDIPLRSAKNYDGDPPPLSPVLVTSENPELLEKWKALNELGKDLPDDADATAHPKQSKSVAAAQEARADKYIRQNWDKIYVQQAVEGIIKTDSLSEKSDDTSHPDKAPDHMTADYVVLDEGKTGGDYKKRSTANGVIALTALAAFWGLGIFVWRRGQRPPSGGGGGKTITLTSRNGEPVVLNADVAHRFRGGGGSGQQNPWSNHP